MSTLWKSTASSWFCDLMLTRGWNFQRRGANTQQSRYSRLSLRLLSFLRSLWGRSFLPARFFGLLRILFDQGIEEAVRLIGASPVTILYHQREIVRGRVFLVLDLQHLLQAFGFRRFLGPASGLAGFAIPGECSIPKKVSPVLTTLANYLRLVNNLMKHLWVFGSYEESYNVKYINARSNVQVTTQRMRSSDRRDVNSILFYVS